MIEYRLAKPGELKIIFELRYRVFFVERGPQYCPELWQYVQSGLLLDKKPGLHVVAVKNGGIIGGAVLYCGGNDDKRRRELALDKLESLLGRAIRGEEVGEVGRAFVTAEHRRRGIHHELLKKRGDELRKRGGNLLVTIVRINNIPSITSLTASGWRKYATIEGAPFELFFKELEKKVNI